MDIEVAVLVDGEFFLKRLESFKRKYFADTPDLTAIQAGMILRHLVQRHLQDKRHNQYLYRVFYYDAPPLDKRAHYPIKEPGQNGYKSIDFKKTSTSKFRNEFFDYLKQQRKFALRLGKTKDDNKWNLKDTALEKLLKGDIEFRDLTNDDFYYSIRQKGVDIKIGIDIANLAQNRYVRKIVLIAGDSDFVPAAKFARTHGVDFVLNPLRNHIPPDLNEHIDGLETFDLVGMLKKQLNQEPTKQPTWWKKSS